MAYTPQQLSDHYDICDVLHAYCRAVDDNRPDDVVALFTADCVYDYGPELGTFDTPEFAYKFFRSGTDKVYKRSAHYLSNVEITFVGPDDAESISYVNAWHEFHDDLPNAWFFGRYVDRHRRTDDGWRIAARRVDAMGHEDWPRPLTLMDRNVLAPRSR
ncbi:MAG: nuclear transport factor 2 family protein [Actinomycetota bacterium]